MAGMSASRTAICSDAVATGQCSWRCLTVLAASVLVLMQSSLSWFSFASSPSLQIDDFSHIGGKYSEIPRDDRRSDVSPGL